jgi:hypothetical protein
MKFNEELGKTSAEALPRSKQATWIAVGILSPH